VLDVVHRRWLEQVEQGLGGRRQSIMNENANENHAVQNKNKIEERRKEIWRTVSNAISVFPAYLKFLSIELQRDFFPSIRCASSIISEGRIGIMNLFFSCKLNSPIILKSILDTPL